MKSLAIFLLFIGTILVIQGYYSGLSYNQSKTNIKFVPRSTYEDQLSDDNTLNKYYKGLFEQTNLGV